MRKMIFEKPVVKGMTIGLMVMTLATFGIFFQGKEETVIIREMLQSAAPLKVRGEALQCTDALQRFYEKREYETLWDKASSVAALVKTIKEAAWEGLDPDDYHLQALERWVSADGKSPAERAEMDLICSDALLLYVSHLASGKVEPQTLDIQWHIVKPLADPLQILGDVKPANLSKTIDAARPKHEEYHALQRSLEVYLKAVDKVHWSLVDRKDTLGEGARSSAVPGIRRMLQWLGYMKQQPAGDSLLFDEKLREGLQQYQQRHGLEATGRLDPGTIDALNVPLAERIDQIAVNMERWRWMPREMGDYYIEANTAGFDLRVVRRGKVERTHRIIVGKAYRRTPVFSDTMKYLVLNPHWTVPPGILKNDVLPAVRKDRAYFARNQMKLYDPSGNELDPYTVDWSDPVVNTYIYRQMPGPHNAMGSVKFMFPNIYSIYLHDTPDKRLFDQRERMFSSGCIRVEHALELAGYLLANDPAKWSEEDLGKALATGNTQTVSLCERPAVYILYLTARADNGQPANVRFYRDIYGRDALIAKALRQPYDNRS